MQNNFSEAKTSDGQPLRHPLPHLLVAIYAGASYRGDAGGQPPAAAGARLRTPKRMTTILLRNVKLLRALSVLSRVHVHVSLYVLTL